MASINQDFDIWDGNGASIIFDVVGDCSAGTAAWKATDALDATSPTTVSKVPTVGSYDSSAGTTPVTLTIATTDFNGYPSTYDHELVITVGGVPTTVAVGKLYVHESIVT